MPTYSMLNYISANDAAYAEATPQSGELSANTPPDCPTIKLNNDIKIPVPDSM